MVKCRKCIGPDADSRARGRVGTSLEDGDVMSTSLQRDRCRKARDTRTDYDELLLRHPSNVSRRMGIPYTSNTSSVLVAVATTAPPASVMMPSVKPTREPALTTVPVAVSSPLLSRTALR